PYRWSDLARAGHTAHAAVLALLPFVALLFLERRFLAGSAGFITMLLFSLPPPAAFNPLPEVELAIALLAGYLARRRARSLPILSCITVFAAALSWHMLFARPDAPRALDASTVAWLARHAPGESSLGAPVPQPGLNALRRQAETLILTPTPNPVRRLYALLWLEALGYSHLVSSAQAEYTPVLEPEHEDDAGFRVYHALVHRPAAAVLVSRYQWRSLPRFRSLYDRAALQAYVAWANRPEAAALRWTTPQTADLRASLGPADMILLRQTAAPGWTATFDGRPLPCLRDPIGFLLLDPQRSGPVVIHLTATAWRPLSSAIPPLPDRVLPIINASGITDGVRHTPPPFAPGTIVTIFGTDLGETGVTKVLAANRACEVLYAGDLQINARLPSNLPPGPASLVVQYAGGQSDPYPIEIR
ncbi:MAG TPA: IPT/TIG domain-containing protein, partial [Bryobacterales bacterium]|nr:IPT/TIG domain-containing protein [Bryobacterales bacterium]